MGTREREKDGRERKGPYQQRIVYKSIASSLALPVSKYRVGGRQKNEGKRVRKNEGICIHTHGRFLHSFGVLSKEPTHGQGVSEEEEHAFAQRHVDKSREEGNIHS